MTFKRICSILIAMILLLCQIACSSAQKVVTEQQPQAAQENILSFRITWTDYSGRGQAIRKIVEQYNQQSADDADIQMIGGNEDMAEIQTLMESDSETVFVLPYRYVQYLGSQGLLSDLTSEFEDAASLFYPAVWQLGADDGIRYGIPWLGHSMCLLYNKTLLKQADITPESIVDLSSFVTAMDKIEQNTDAKGIGLVGANSNDISWMVNQFVYGFGGMLVDSTGKNILINSPESTAAIEFYRDVLGAHAQTSWQFDAGTEVMKSFLNQEVAFEIQGIWGITDVQKNGSPFEVGVIPLKQIGVCSEIGPMMLAIPNNMSEEGRSQAIAFIRYMISIDAQQAILNGEYSPEHDAYYPFRTPIRMDMADTPLMQMYPIYQIFIEGFGNPSIDVPTPAWQIIKEKYYEPGLHSVMTGAMSTNSFLAMIEAEGNKILETN